MDQDNSNSNTNSNSNSSMNACDVKKDSRNCLYCLQEVEGSLRCSKCRTALYCGKAVKTLACAQEFLKFTT
jgi:hypothetical protein